jgi:ABC-type Zn uptake system ZnuABC Zn-binding protein ZnuA
MVVKMSRAQLFVRNGMDLDMWADGILDKSSNAQVMRGAPGYVDCSQGITKLEVPSGKLNPSMGDIHVYGNPHYLMDPASGIIAAQEITLGLMRVDPAGKDYYKSQYDLFAHQLVDHIRMWQTWLAPYRGAKIVIYHEDWAYFFHRFDLVGFGTMEPKPGMPPSPGHVDDLIRQMKDAHVKVMLLENFRSHRYPDRITAETGATAVYVPLAVEGSPEATNYFMLFDTIITRLVKALHG